MILARLLTAVKSINYSSNPKNLLLFSRRSFFDGFEMVSQNSPLQEKKKRWFLKAKVKRTFYCCRLTVLLKWAGHDDTLQRVCGLCTLLRYPCDFTDRDSVDRLIDCPCPWWGPSCIPKQLFTKATGLSDCASSHSWVVESRPMRTVGYPNAIWRWGEDTFTHLWQWMETFTHVRQWGVEAFTQCLTVGCLTLHLLLSQKRRPNILIWANKTDPIDVVEITRS